MPHKASVLLQSTNAVTGDPTYLSERNGAIAGVDSIAGYKGAAAAGTDGVSATWTRGAGFNVNVSQDQGTDAVSDQGVVSIAIGSPKFSRPS